MTTRKPTVIGRFYEASEQKCREHLEIMRQTPLPEIDIPTEIIAGIVPHAGWVFSGNLAMMVFKAIKRHQKIDTFVIFGAIHTVYTDHALIYDTGQWQSPLGNIDIDQELAQEILENSPDLIKSDRPAHNQEHSIEVQIPLIQFLFPQAQIVPIMVPPVAGIEKVGPIISQVIQNNPNKKIACIASTDLTHYGPSYHFTPMGTGEQALKWAKDNNDKQFIDKALSMDYENIVPAAQMYHNACGAGAVATVVAAAANLGTPEGSLLAHTSSAEIMENLYQQSSLDSVGYAAIVYGK